MAGYHGPPGPAHQPNGHLPPGMGPPQQKTVAQALASANEAAWIQLGKVFRHISQCINTNVSSGSLSELQGDTEGAIQAYEHAVQHNSYSIPALSAIAAILRNRDNYGLSIEYLRTILKLDGANGDIWGQLGRLQAISSSTDATWILIVLLHRTLLSHDGQSARGLLCVSASSLSSHRPEGKSSQLGARDQFLIIRRSPSFGTASASSTIVMDRSNMPKKHFRK